MDYIEVSFIVTPYQPYSDILISDLAEINFESFDEKAPELLAYCQAGQFSESELKTALQGEEFSECKISYTIKTIPAQNWNAIWESSFAPIEVGNRLMIRAPFHDAFKGELEVIIEPKMSFGTGHHDTTWLICETILELPVKDTAVLDMGCGTSVLAILVSKLGAKSVKAIDIDDWSVENSKENIVLNNRSNISVEKGDASLLKNEKYNLILANINRNVLLVDMAVYSNCLEKNGVLLLSGFFVTDIPVLVDKANDCGLTLVKQKEKNSWACLYMQKEN